jgi:hypothetical protein
MWKVAPDTSNPHATLGVWLAKIPEAHPAWHSYAISVVHLRPAEGVKDANKHYPGAEYEILIFALDPEAELNPNLPRTIGPALLTPPNLVFQFHGVRDEQAVDLTEMLAKSFCDGVNSPDTDFRERTEGSLHTTLEHMILGDHPGSEVH